MSKVNPSQRLSDLPAAEAALMELCRPFASPDFDPRCIVVQPNEIPHPQDQLLVHHRHMTVELEHHHGAPVQLHVLDWRQDGNIYTRKLVLTPTGSDRCVEWGLVRMNFNLMSREVRDEIVARQTPLGAILIKHHVLRRVKPRWFLRLPADGPVIRLFDPAHAETADDCYYGRIGTIYCNEEPAIELLEIVLNVVPAKVNTK